MEGLENRYDTIPAIKTEYNKLNFRSRLEAKWAVFFDFLGIYYKYESKLFYNGETKYLPDFYFVNENCYVEIKPEKPTELEISKILMVAETEDILLCVGEPGDGCSFLYLAKNRLEKGYSQGPFEVILNGMHNVDRYTRFFYNDTFDPKYFEIEHEYAMVAKTKFYFQNKNEDAWNLLTKNN